MTQFNAPAYDIERPTGVCAFTGRTLEPGEAYIATLIEPPPPPPPPPPPEDGASGDMAQAGSSSAASALGLKRLDVSLEAWQQGQRPEHLFSHWKATVPQPNEKKKLFVDDDVLLNLLRRLADATEPQRIAFRFVLCLILMRRKMLRYNRTERRTVTVTGEGGEAKEIEQSWWLLTPKLDPAKGPLGKWNDEEKIEVLDPHLDEAQTQQVTEQLSEVLQAEL